MRTNADIRQYLGSENTRNQNNRPFAYVANFTTAIAVNGGQGRATFTIDNSWTFVCKRIVPMFTTAVLVGNTLAGTPLPDVAEPLSTSNNLPNLSMVGLQIKTDINNFDQEIRASVFGSGARFQDFELDPWIFPASQLVEVTATNYSPAAVTTGIVGQVVFFGYRVGISSN